MADFRTLSDTVLASPQIEAAQLAEAKADGVTLIVCNRPDGEELDQPTASEIEAAATEAGLAFVHIPVTGAGFNMNQVEAMADALDGAHGKVLAYCRSGTRSTFLWSLAQAKAGADPAGIAEAARKAGYDVTPVYPAMQALANDAG